MIEILMYIGIAFSELSYIPQIWKLHKKKKAKQISLYFPVMNIVGRLCIAIATFDINIILSMGFVIGTLLTIIFTWQVVHYKIKKKNYK